METANKVIEVLDYICAKLGIVIDWTADTISQYLPIILQKFVAYEASSYIFWICFGILWLIGGAICSRQYSKYVKRANEDGYGIDFDDIETLWVVAAVACFGIGLTITCCNIYDLVHLLVFPEFAFYQYVTKLIK